MPVAQANGIEIAYEQFGRKGATDMLLIQGLGMPLSAWPQPLIDDFVSRGFRVTIFDNRDIGRSEIQSHYGKPNIAWQLVRTKIGLGAKSPYKLEDMATDTSELMSALAIDGAHVVGVSMGGMISQLLAIHFPERVRSLTSIMSTTARPGLPQAKPAIARQLLSRPKSQAIEDRIEFGKKTWRMIGSPAYDRDDETLEAFLRGNLERGVTAEGLGRQMLAIATARSRVEALSKLAVSTLVMHGEEDPLVPIACGEDTARCIPNARLIGYPGMGHDLPQPLWQEFCSEISNHARKAERTR